MEELHAELRESVVDLFKKLGLAKFKMDLHGVDGLPVPMVDPESLAGVLSSTTGRSIQHTADALSLLAITQSLYEWILDHDDREREVAKTDIENRSRKRVTELLEKLSESVAETNSKKSDLWTPGKSLKPGL